MIQILEKRKQKCKKSDKIDRKKFLRLFFQLLLTFVICLGILIGLLYATSFIPKEAIKENLLTSAEYLLEREDEFYCYIEEDKRTQVDNYADTILFNIMYSLNEEQRFESMILSMFYSDEANQEFPMIELLQESIVEEKAPDTIYDRYWHGMQVVLRPLFTVFHIVQIRYLILAVLLVLLLILSVILWKKKEKCFAISLWAGAVLVGLPMVAFCVEYMDTWLIMLIVSLLCVKYYKKSEIVLRLMVISGVCCGFFDFLTTETLAVILPLAMTLCLREKENLLNGFKDGFSLVAASGMSWVMGYVLTLISKWTISSIVTQSNRFEAAFYMMFYRIGKDVTSNVEHSFGQPLEALAENLKLLTGIPVGVDNSTVILISGIICAVLGCLVFLYRKSGKVCILPALLFLIGLVPIVRFFVLSSHSYQHSYFTYRALFAAICCVMVAIVKIIDWQLIKSMVRRR